MGAAADLRIYLLTLGLAHRSVTEYTRAVLRAEAWMEPHGFDLMTAPVDLLMDWAETLPRTTSSRRRARTALGHYWKMAGRPDSPGWTVRVPRKGRSICRALEPDEASRLAAAAKARGDRQGLAVLFGLYLALRLSEIAAVRWADVDGEWLKLVGKGDLPAELPVHPSVLAALATVGRTHDTWVFPGRQGDGPVHPATVWGWVRQVAVDAGVPRLTTHRLRHTCLATANDSTGDLRAVQEFARHVRPETTAIYTRATAGRLLDVMRSLDYDDPDA